MPIVITEISLRDRGSARWFEGLIPIFWLYERVPDERLLHLMKQLQVQGFDWPKAFDAGLIESLTQGWEA